MGRHQTSHDFFGFAVAFVALLLAAPAWGAAPVVAVEVKDAITPPVASYITDAIDAAVQADAQAIIIRLDTPGGLDTSMREIIQKEMNAPIPVIVYVSPQGARAASAGALICMAADIAAMAPGTNIGAAHPVGVGGGGGEEGKSSTMVEKVTNDAVAYSKSIARERGRNEQWAEDAVKKSISTPASEALERHVIDLMADSQADLLAKLDGRTIKKHNQTYTLKTKDAVVQEQTMGFRTRILSTISNPNIAYILMLVGLAGIYFELSSPGAILPGIVGGISLILAFFAFQALPVNYAGMALILLAVILFIAEIKVPSYGLLTVGGVVSMVLGSLMLFRTPHMYAQISLGVILPLSLFFAAFFALCVYLVVKVHRTRPVVGAAALIGEHGTVYLWNENGTGKVFAHGEYWNAQGPQALQPGETVEIERVDGMTITVKPVAPA